MFQMAEDLGINQLLPHLTLKFQRVSLARGFRTAGMCFFIVVELNNPIFSSFVYSVIDVVSVHQISDSGDAGNPFTGFCFE